MKNYVKFILILIIILISVSCSETSQDTKLVPCTTSDDCTNGMECINSFCMKKDEFQKEECQNDIDCPDGFVCNKNHLCEIKKCSSRDDCSEGEICLNNLCTSGCEFDTDCKSNEKCNTLTHECERLGNCNENPQICQQGYECDTFTGKCTPKSNCQTNLDCAIGYKCQDTQCIPKVACQSNEECSSGEVCRADGYCDVDTGCDSDQYCINKNPSKPACSTISGLCYECVTNDHCHDLSKPICNTMTHTCGTEEGPSGECQVDSDCGINKKCNTAVSPHECVDMMTSCHSDNDCQNGMHCNTSNGRCVMCLNDSHCIAPKTCNLNTYFCEDNSSGGSGGGGSGSGGNGVCADLGGMLSCILMGGECQGEDCVINETDPCEGVNCPANSTCNNGTCECNTGYHISGNECIENETCDGVTCPDNSHCEINNYEAGCYCNEGYTAQDTDGDGQKDTCVANNPCDGVTCSNHGTCTVSNNQAVCQCDAGYHANGLYCVEDTQTCDLDSLSTPLNNTPETAKTITLGNYDNLTLSNSNCNYVEDWYKIQLNANTTFKLVLSYRDISSNITVKLYKQPDTANEVASNTSTQYTREINYEVTQDNTYYIRVFIYYQAEQRPISYSMTLTSNENHDGNPADICSDDNQCFGDSSFCATTYTDAGYCTSTCNTVGAVCMDSGVCDGKHCFKKCTDGDDTSCGREDLVCQDYNDGAGPICVAKCYQNSDCSTNYCVSGHCKLHYMDCNLNDPFNDGCATGEFCTTYNNSTLCYPNGNGTTGSTCEWQGDCMEGLGCIGNDTDGYFCTELCVWSDDCSDTGDACYAFTPDSNGYRQYRYESDDPYGYCD